jgi:uncharacterized protein (DUF305 family)
MKRMTLFLLLITGGIASAQTPTPGGDTPSTTAYKHSMETMMKGMDQPYTGNADHDFVTGMLPHHQGAIDMARVELRYGRNPAMRRLAHEIIASQTQEERLMRVWLGRHPAPPAH